MAKKYLYLDLCLTLGTKVGQMVCTWRLKIYPKPRMSEQPKQDYNIINKRFNDIHLLIELSVIGERAKRVRHSQVCSIENRDIL